MIHPPTYPHMYTEFIEEQYLSFDITILFLYLFQLQIKTKLYICMNVLHKYF